MCDARQASSDVRADGTDLAGHVASDSHCAATRSGCSMTWRGCIDIAGRIDKVDPARSQLRGAAVRFREAF